MPVIETTLLRWILLLPVVGVVLCTCGAQTRRNPANRELKDLSLREMLAVVPIIIMIFWIGLYPKPFLDRIEPTAQVLLGRLKAAGATRYLAPDSD
jgi:NADH:ubiquinone oxidoreductase subunit 4 (subunit M)